MSATPTCQPASKPTRQLPSQLPVAPARGRPRSALGALGALGAGCSKDVIDAFPVQVTALGNQAPVAVTLEWPDGTETLELPPNGSEHFEAHLIAGTGALVRGPGDCRFSNIDTAIALTTEEQPSELRLACPGVLELTSLGASQPVLQSQENLSYQLTLGALRVNPSPDVSITPVARQEGATVKINNGSAPQLLRLGTNSIDVAFPGFGLARSYSVTLTTAAKEREHSRTAGPDAGGQLGATIAAAGDLVAVGAPGATASKVLLFRHAAGGWTLEATLVPEADAGAASGFGATLLVTGTTVVVGAPADDYVAENAGAVYVFTKIGNNWSLASRFNRLAPNSSFGAAMALAADGQLAVGAPDEGGGIGAVYVYPRLDGVAPQRLSASNFAAGDRFGAATAFAGGKLLIGAPGEDGGLSALPSTTDNSVPNSGALYRYAFATSWSADAFYKSSPMPVSGGGFGERLAGDGDWAAASWYSGASGAVDVLFMPAGYRYSITTPAGVLALALDHARIALGLPAGAGAVKISAYRLDAANASTLAQPFTSATAAGDDGFGRALGFGGDRLFVGAARQGAQSHGAFYAFE